MTTASPGTGAEVVEARIARLTARVEELHDLLSDLTDRIHSNEPATAAPAETTAPLAYVNTHAWVEDYLAPTYTRPLGGEWRWCARWDEHAEARTRLEALWRTWEHHRTDPINGIAIWLHDHLDHHLPILLSSRGPFASCSPTRHEPLTRLPVTQPPEV
jgi:hypothetical protein